MSGHWIVLPDLGHRMISPMNLKDTSKNVIPAKAGIHKLMTLLDSRLRGSDKFGIIRGSLNI
jgi:hypothetical protein